MEKKISVLDILEMDLSGHNSLDLRCLSGRRFLSNEIFVPDINRPGLALSGFYESFAPQRVQVFGRGETAFLEKSGIDGKGLPLHEFFQYPIPCCIFTHGLFPPQIVFDLAEEGHCPILSTDLDSSEFSNRLLRVFSNVFAPVQTIHGVLVEVFGVGVLLLGDSGIGKSETALELIERGHRLVADDMVEIHCVNGNTLVGKGANRMINHHMEVRGIGIINIVQLYGVGAIRDEKNVQFVVKLEEWDANKLYDRVGIEENTTEFLGVKIPLIEIPVKPGRNVPIIIETAAKNERLKSQGYFSALEFNRNVLKWIETETAQRAYYTGDDSY
jgi:HPr kinase/phosphorylase